MHKQASRSCGKKRNIGQRADWEHRRHFLYQQQLHIIKLSMTSIIIFTIYFCLDLMMTPMTMIMMLILATITERSRTRKLCKLWAYDGIAPKLLNFQCSLAQDMLFGRRQLLCCSEERLASNDLNWTERGGRGRENLLAPSSPPSNLSLRI